MRRGLTKLILGRALPTEVQLEHRLPIFLALPVFASDAISSVAYATQEVLMVLMLFAVAPGVRPVGYQLYISAAIAVLIVIVALSYRQAIHLYPSGGGSYSVARDNLGVAPGLIAAAALIIDYILTVAVSVSAGVDAVVSINPQHLYPIKVELAIILVGFITLINLRGVRESGWTFALPAYLFTSMLLTMIGFIVYHVLTGTVNPLPPSTDLPDPRPVAGFLLGLVVLRAFSSGCAALTGVEAVSNGVSAFEPPEAKNAARTLSVLMIILVTLFLGIGLGAHMYHVLPTEKETALSLLGGAIYGTDLRWNNLLALLYYVTQGATMLILMIAANTSFAGLPRLLALVAQDGYAPKAFTHLGDRLVYTRGILALAIVSGILVVVFRANVTALIGLYAVGVFICFTLSQLGMVKKVQELRERGWKRMMIVNSIGAFVTGSVAVITLVTKFFLGAALVAILVPLLVAIGYAIKRHYKWFDETMTVHPTDFNPLKAPVEPLTVLVLVSSDVHRGILEGLECGRAIAEGKPNSVLRAIHIEMDPEKTPRLLQRWEEFVQPYLGQEIRLDIVPSPFRWLIEPVMEYVDQVDRERLDHRVFIVLPEFETGSVITHFLHNFTARRLRSALFNRPHITVVSSRYFMRPIAWRRGRGGLVY
ncbi:MAG: APC family permease [Armatimonadota bacterium]